MSNNYNQLTPTSTKVYNFNQYINWSYFKPVLVVEEGVVNIILSYKPQETIYFPFNYHNNNLVYKHTIKDPALKIFKEYKRKHRDKISKDFLNNINK